MITEWLVTSTLAVTEWVVGLFAPLDLPEWLVDADEMVTGLIDEYGEGLGVWVDWHLVGPVLAVGIAVWVGALGLKVVRVLVAHIPFFGGKG